VRDRGDGPKHDRTDETSFSAYAIVKLSRKALANRVGQEKPGNDAAKLCIGKTEIASDHRGQHRDRQPIDVIDQRGEKDQADDPPTQSSELESSLGRCRFSSLCVQHVLTAVIGRRVERRTSPTVSERSAITLSPP